MTPPSIPFVLKSAFTLIGISDSMANTTHDEIIVASLLPVPEFRPRYSNSSQGSWRYGTFKLKGKRKEFYIDIRTEDTLVFAGHGVVLRDWDLPRRTSGGGGFTVKKFSGNACINLGGTVEFIRQLVTEKNLNPAFKGHELVMAIPPLGDGTYGSKNSHDHDDGIPVFPDEPSTHAVVTRLREKHRPALAALPDPVPALEVEVLPALPQAREMATTSPTTFDAFADF